MGKIRNKLVTCPACGETTAAFPCGSCDADPDGAAQLASDRDEAAEDRDRAAELRDRGADDRDERAREQDQKTSDHDGTTDQTWSDADQAASGRDQLSADKDQRSADIDFAAGGDEVTHRLGVQARGRSRKQRKSVSRLRDDTSDARAQDDPAESDREDDRLRGEQDREMASGDRVEAADDRQQSARERAQAVQDSIESASAAQRAIETLESMSDAFFTLDPEWRFIYANPQTEVLLERQRETLIGTSIWEEFPEMAGSRFDLEYRRALEEQVPVRFEEVYEPLGRTFEVRVYPVVAGLAVYFSDVTDERLRDARLRQTERLEMLGRLTAGVAHDFRNLLTITAGFANLGLAHATDEATKTYFGAIASAGEKAGALTRQLLAFAREQELSPTVLDLNEVIQGLASLLAQLMPNGITFRLEPSPEPVYVFVDRTQLEQVVLNLVVNSRDAIETTGSVTVSTSAEDPTGMAHDFPGPCGWLQVADTGSGIPSDVRPHIFDPFFSTKPRETGTGLGLATIYGIVSQSGGSIFVDSTVDVGTTMTVMLPADPVSRSPSVL